MHGSRSPRIPAVFVCEGHDCVKRDGDAVAGRLSRAGLEVTRVRCQKICDGPVIGVGSPADVVWFERMDSAKAEDALVELVEGGVVDKVLRKRRVTKREGKLRD